MTGYEAEQRGYRLANYAPFMVGLYYQGAQVCKWWIGTFGQRMPDLSTSEVLQAVEAHEKFLSEPHPTF